MSAPVLPAKIIEPLALVAMTPTALADSKVPRIVERKHQRPAVPVSVAKPKLAAGTRTEASSTAKADNIYLGIDAHAVHQVVVEQVDASAPKPAQNFSVEKLLVFAKKQLGLAHRVVACYEAGPCGYSLCRKLIELGIEAVVVRPKCWDEFGKDVKTDARDARALCEALERYTRGNPHALSVIRLPTEAEEQARSITRQRDALIDTRKRVAAQREGSGE